MLARSRHRGLEYPMPLGRPCQPTTRPGRSPAPARSAKFHAAVEVPRTRRPRFLPAGPASFRQPAFFPPSARQGLAGRAALDPRATFDSPACPPARAALPGRRCVLGRSSRKFFFVHKLAASDRLVTGMMNLRFPRPVPSRRQVVHRWPCGGQQHGQVVPSVFHNFAHRHVDCLRRPCHRAGDEAPAEQRPSLCKGKAERGNGPKGVSLHSGEQELRQGRREDAAW
jgi:hypothetical protein